MNGKQFLSEEFDERSMQGKASQVEKTAGIGAQKENENLENPSGC
jgi:hypothetical protein